MSLFKNLLTNLADGINPEKERQNETAESQALAAQRGLLRALVEQGCENFYREVFGSRFVEAWGAHHREAIEWHWDARLGFLRIAERQGVLEREIDAGKITREEFQELLDAFTKQHKPEYLAYFPIWSRGNMKSYVAERIAVTDAMLSFAFAQPGFCLYIGREKTKIIEHVSNIESLLSSPKVRHYAPQLSEVKVNEETNQKRQWTGRFLHTRADYVFKGGSVDSAQAGSRVEDTRVTFMVFDDVDGREESIVISQGRARRITGELLPMRQHNTLVFWAQNLINRYSVMYQVYKNRLPILTNRKPTHPVPAVKNLEVTKTTENGIVKYKYKSGTPTWHVWTADRVNDEIESEGYEAFKKECQHEVEGAKEGRVYVNYDDALHVITESEFEAVYGVRRPPAAWYKYFTHDWARTKTMYHANVAFWSAVSPQSGKFPGFFFIYEPMSFEADVQPDTCAVRFLKALQEKVSVAGVERDWEDLLRDNLSRHNFEHHITDATKLIEMRRRVIATVLPQYVQSALKRHNVKKMRFSHDRDDILRVYNSTYGFNFHPANPTNKAGIQEINDLMMVDENLPHPFKPGVLGYTRFFIIVPDEKAERQTDLSPELLHDHDLIRYQFLERRYLPPKVTETGERGADELEKANDDFGQAFEFLMMDNAPFNEPLSEQEQVAETIRIETPHLAPEAMAAVSEEERAGLMQAKLQKIKEVQRSIASGQGGFKNPMKKYRKGRFM